MVYPKKRRHRNTGSVTRSGEKWRAALTLGHYGTKDEAERVLREARASLGLPNSLEEAFRQRIARNDRTACWEWTGPYEAFGYGRFWIKGRGRHYKAHRVAAWLWKGFDLDSEMHVLHHCDNPACVNPDHLYIGTNVENGRDRSVRRRCRVPHPRGQGEANHNAVLTDAIVRDIKARVRSGERQHLLAKKYGISQAHVSRLVRGKSWAHVKEASD